MRGKGPQNHGSTNGQRPRPALRFRGLKAQIVLWMVLPLTLVLIGVAFTGVYSHEQAMRGLVQERDQALVVVSANRVRDLLNLRVTALEMLAAQEAFHHQDRAAQRDLLAQAGDLPAPGTQAQMRRLFVGNIVLVDKTGDLITSSTAPPAWTQDERLSSLARTVMAHQDVSLTPPTDTPWGEDIFLLGVPIYNETGPIYGALVGPVSLGNLDLETLLSQVQVGKHGMAYLVNASGQVLAHAPADSLAGPTCLGVVLQAAGAGTALCQAPDGEWITLAYAPVDFYVGWRVLVEQPWREVIGSVLRYSQFMPLVAALAAVISLLTLYYGIRSIVRPLQALGQRAERVAWGDFDATSTSVGGVEEIEDLRRTLDQMAKRIQSYQSGMHDYIAAITRGQEEERERLARELHDDRERCQRRRNATRGDHLRRSGRRGGGEQPEVADGRGDQRPRYAGLRFRQSSRPILQGVHQVSAERQPGHAPGELRPR